MKIHSLAVFLPALALLSCDRSEVVDPSTSKTFTLAPRIVSANGVSLPAVDSVRIAVLNANSPTASPYYDKSLDYKLHGDTIEGIPQNAQLDVRVSGVKIQRDSSRAVWWSGKAVATFSGTQTVDAQSLPVPVFVGDTTAPRIISRPEDRDTIESTDTAAHLVWQIREDSTFTAVANGDTLRRFSDGSDSVVWQHTWAGKSLPVVLLLRDKTGNLSRDSLTVIRRDRVAPPVFSLKAGSYTDTIRVSLSDSTSGSELQYSIDGGSSWVTYDTALLFGSNVTLQARATKLGMTGSAISSAAYLVQAATPTFSVASGTSSNDLLAVKLSSATSGATFQYSLDGTTWMDYKDSLVLGSNAHVYARTLKSGVATSAVAEAIYSVRAAAPVITGATSGTYHAYQTLRLATATPDAKIRYTLDGTDPVETSTLYVDSVLIDTSCIIKAKAFKTGLAPSTAVSAQYVLSLGGTISISIPTTSALWYTRNVLLTSDQSSVSIHCTTDGSAAGKNSPLCNDSITVGDGATVNVAAYSTAHPKLSPTMVVFTYPSTWNTAITYGTLLDSRDGKNYRTVKIGDQTWMAENLNYRNATGHSDTVGECYNGNLDTCQKYGRLYTWVEVMASSSSSTSIPSGVQGICPSSWHVPSDAEWSTLIQYVDSATSGTKLNSTVGWNSGTDAFGFRVLPADNLGCDGPFGHLGRCADFWSSSENDASTAWNRNVYYGDAGVDRYYYLKSGGFSLRCVKDN